METVSFNVNGSGFKGGNVPARECGLVGFYASNGKPYLPNDAAVRALLPSRWRRAFDKAAGWWEYQFDGAGKRYAFRRILKAANGRILTVIYAHGLEKVRYA